MRFGEIATEHAVGAILAHRIRAGKSVFQKGHYLTRSDISVLLSESVKSIWVAQLDRAAQTFSKIQMSSFNMYYKAWERTCRITCKSAQSFVLRVRRHSISFITISSSAWAWVCNMRFAVLGHFQWHQVSLEFLQKAMSPLKHPILNITFSRSALTA